MPKRDFAYMEGQRDQIAKAALECLIENGVAETSLRDICKRAGVSIGALYVHFPTKEDLILAACALDNEEYQFNPIPSTWAEFEAAMTKMFLHLRTARQLKRMRLALQFTANLAVSENAPVGLFENYRIRLSSLRKIIERLKASGEITAPMGVDATTTSLFNFVIGTNYTWVASQIELSADLLDEMFAAMAVLAGRAQKL